MELITAGDQTETKSVCFQNTVQFWRTPISQTTIFFTWPGIENKVEKEIRMKIMNREKTK